MEKHKKTTKEQLLKENERLRIKISKLEKSDLKHAKSKDATLEIEEDLENIFNLSPDMVGIFTTKGKLLKVNPAWEQTLGYTQKEILKSGWAKLVHPDDIELTNETVTKQLKSRAAVNFVNRYKCKDGSYKTLEWQATVAKNGVVHATARDITEKKKAEETLKESEEKYRALFERESDAIFLHDPADTKIIIANEATSKMYGYTKKELIGMSCLEFSAEVEKSVSAMKEAQKNGDVIIPTRYHKKKDGTVFPVDISGHKVILGGKELIFAVCKDITQRVKAEEALKKSESRLASAQEIGLIGTWNLDIINDVLEWTEQNYKIFGVKPGTPMDMAGFSEIIHPDDRNYVNEKWTAGMNGEKYDIEHRLLIDGKVKWVREKADVTFNKKGKAISAVGITQDITEKKKTEEALKESEEKHRAITETIPGAVYECDMDWTFLFISPGFKELTGFPASDIINNNVRSYVSLMYEDDIKRITPSLDEAIKRKDQFYFSEYKLKSKRKKIIWVHDSVRILYDMGGKAIGYKGVLLDITEQKKIEEKLKESEEKFRKLFESSKDALMTLAPPTWKFTSGNPSIIEMFGVKDEKEFTSLGPWDLSPKYQPDGQLSSVKAKKMIGKAMKTGHNFFEWTHCKYKGEDFYATVLLTRVDLGEEKFLQATVRNITQQKKAAQTIQESNALLSSIIESPDNVIMFAIDRSYNYIGFNNAHKKEMKLLFDADIEIGQPILSYVDNENDRLKSEKNYERVLEGERFTIIEQYEILENRSWYELIFNPIIDESKKVTGFTVYVANITDRKLAEEELIKAKEKAEEADHLKSAFLANMSHEIRTPMNGILGFLGLLKEPNLTDDKKDKYINIVNKGGERLLNTINDIIEISKIESDNIEIENERIEIKNLLNYYYDFFLPQTKSKQLDFRLVGINKLENRILYTDKNKLDSILTNLLKNAIKFTTIGKIELGCKVGKNELKFFVKDTGMGIKKDRLKAVFERFIQADINITKGYEGSGLGLAISSSYVEMLGGKIWVESEENNGSTFYFTLPMDNGRKNGDQADSLEKKLKGDMGTKGTPKRLKILITEDDEVSSVFLETLLQGINCEVLKSSTGAEAVYLCKHNPDIDIILMDIKLPDMNGYDATRKIREFNNKVKIIAQTAFAFAGDEVKAIQAGCNEYITKPIKKEILFSVIDKYRKTK